MATFTKNLKIFDFIIKPIMVYMMNIQSFIRFFANRTFVRVKRECKFSITSLSMFKRAVIFKSILRFIATNDRTKLFFKEFCSRFRKCKKFTTQFTISRHLRSKFHRLITTFFRTIKCFRFTNSMDWNRKHFSTEITRNNSLFFLEVGTTFKRAKKIFSIFEFVRLNFKKFITKRAIYFHIQHDSTQEVLC